MNAPDVTDEAIRRLVAYLKRDLASLEAVGVAPDFLELYQAFIAAAPKALGSKNASKQRRKASQPELQLDAMSLADLERTVNDTEVPRSRLERIAVQVFGVPSGSLRAYGTKEMLRAKLQVMIEGREAHRSIERLSNRQET